MCRNAYCAISLSITTVVFFADTGGTGVSETCAADKEGTINKQLLEDILHETRDRSSFKRLDPAQGGGAEKEWSHRLEEIEISDLRLRQTHDKVSERFGLIMVSSLQTLSSISRVRPNQSS